ncbi:MBL fold metallo-hydrolase [Oscillatoria sp. CS-180]|uniref:MBL fold metallo-hydrolase n=1 Tax=Oscillatoria sp. CS-180 TaxID=3021720 RepID=UPI00232F1CA2|nr:MBL fold metallo-hydrolase [Oscillatoria sp. CS-180]MDB9526019.1 MBL fold metallo-hydrolase [Oscillatoria sp. CS-180]
MFATWLDNNSWLWEIADQRILVDPWLVGPLVFGNAAWLFKGEKAVPRSLPENIDCILLSQGLEDHAHPQTLKALDKSLPVVGSSNAIKVARELGFADVTTLDHGEAVTRGGVTIKAVPGAPIGPTLVENGYVVTENATGLKLFYEPHGYHQEDLKVEAPIDVVITPMMNLALPLLGPVVRGIKSANELAEWLQPQVMLPTTDAQETEYEGFLPSILKATGGVSEIRERLTAAGQSVEVLDMTVGDRTQLSLTPRTVTA